MQQTFATQLKNRSLKSTPARLAILDFLRQANLPITARELHQGLGDQQIDQATIYRNLTRLHQVGLVSKVTFNGRVEYFELADKGDHHHIVCTCCGLIEEIELCPLPTIIDQIAHQAQNFITIKQHNLEFYSLCLNCDKTSTSNN